MSVVAHSPFSGSKRLFEEVDTPDSSFDRQHPSGTKRTRCLGSAPARCLLHEHSYAVTPSALNTLRSLFPGMNDKVVADVLAECGNDVDAAIRRLGELSLSTGPPPTTSGNSRAGSAASSPSRARPELPAAGPIHAEAAHPALPQTAEAWVEYLVQQMLVAKDLDDARNRAASVLGAFEHFIALQSKDKGQEWRVKYEEAVKENHILKRAVQIQNARMQEVQNSRMQEKDLEVAHLKQVLSQYQEKVKSLEHSNYSLALHLSKAIDTSQQTGPRPPDVF